MRYRIKVRSMKQVWPWCYHADVVWQLLQGGMELRVLHAAAHKTTWYGQWGYQYGRGAFNITHSK